MDLHPLDGPRAVIRVDPPPGFLALREDALLDRYRINLEIGRVKNVNKNPVAEKAVAELEEEILRQEPGRGPVSQLCLSTAIARLHSHIRDGGLSAREMYTQSNQFTHEQLPMCDKDIIVQKQAQRDSNHISSALSKANSKGPGPIHVPSIGDIVYLYSDRDKTKARPRYIVVSKNDEWLYIKVCRSTTQVTLIQGQEQRMFLRSNRSTDLTTKHQQHFVHEDDDQEEDTTSKPRTPETNIFDNPHRDTYNTGSPPIPEVLSTPPCATEVEQETPQEAFTEDDEEDVEEQVTSRPQRMRKPLPYLKDYVVS